MARSRSSGRWLSEHFRDEYVKQAHAEGYRSRAVFKLMEIQERDRLLRPGMRVLDLGSAPGGWSQYAAGRVGRQGKVYALDVLPMEAIPGVEFVQGDFCEQTVWQELTRRLAGQKVDVVLSDMAPNMSGTRAIDQPRAIYFAELALETAKQVLAEGGALLVKMFQGAGFDEFKRECGQFFDKVQIRKPKASKSRSREVYLLAQGFKAA